MGEELRRNGTKNISTLLTSLSACFKVSGIEDASDWDMSKWAPLVHEKQIVPWLVKQPSEAEALRARPCNVTQVGSHPLALVIPACP